MPRSAKLKAWDIYAKELLHLGFGHPLWIPEPSPESGEVQLGDVGYLSQGKFCFLFNCMRGADDQVNRRGVPEGFEVFIPPDGPVEESANTIRNIIQNKLLLSKHARSVKAEASISLGMDPLAHVEVATSYEVTQKTGAYLALKRDAHQTNLHCTEAIFRYLRNHHSEWLRFAIERRGRELDVQQILFVSGFVKTAVWAVGAFSHGSSSATLKIDAGAMFGGGVSASAGGAMSLSNCSAPTSLHRTGPPERLPWNDDTLHSDDQCIFLHYAHLKPRWAIPGLHVSTHSWPVSGQSESTLRRFSASYIEKDDDRSNSSLEDGLEHIGDQVGCVVSSRDQIFLHDRPEDIEAHGPDNSDFANESYRENRRLSPDEDHSLPVSPTFSQRQYGVHGPIESFGEVQDFDAASRPCPRDVLDSEVANNEPGHRVSLQEREQAIEVSDGNGSGDEDESEDDEDDEDDQYYSGDDENDQHHSGSDEVDGDALDHILEHSDCDFACASTQDLLGICGGKHRTQELKRCSRGLTPYCGAISAF
ncbi:hypothetical protein OH76DRAFT_1192777 [Lentinus brumalis]|uniref:Uncharacterized protein n=1 Tax=Lentinus brumalis TaxID=2498619 RepID=A0A371CT86_9APHY|nr:hypothetical protein OH76DRAFT_1192777 [Polyporus brumalis]